MVTRRDFVKTTAAVAAGSLILPMAAFKPTEQQIGLALYTVREDMNKDLAGTLARVAEIGYNHLEAASYSNRQFYGMKPSDFRKMIDGLNMKLLSTHSMVNTGNIEAAVEDAAEAGIKYLVLPMLMGRDYLNTAENCEKTADMLNQFGEVCNASGIRFAYHNHAFEFAKVEEKVPYDILLEETDPSLVTFEPDLYWMVKAGVNPVDYFNKYNGRFEIWHLKDMEDTEEQSFAEIGQGTIDFKNIFTAKKSAGMVYYFVEQDSCKNHPPLESIKISYDYLKKMGF